MRTSERTTRTKTESQNASGLAIRLRQIAPHLADRPPDPTVGFPVFTDDDLLDIANASHERFVGCLRTGIKDQARVAGAALREMKERVPHGEWTPWLKENFDGSPQTARVYMQIARCWESIVEQGWHETATLEQLRHFLADQNPKNRKPEPGLPEDDDELILPLHQPSAPPRQVVLTLSPDDDEFDDLVTSLMEFFGTTNPTDTVYCALRECWEVRRG